MTRPGVWERNGEWWHLEPDCEGQAGPFPTEAEAETALAAYLRWLEGPNRVLFLDFDGVINNHRTAGTVGEYLRPPSEVDPIMRLPVEPACAGVLNTILSVTGCRVVLSTSWRITAPLDVIARSLAAHGIVADVIGATPDPLNDVEWRLRREALKHYDRFTRGDEIRDWLSRHLEVDEFVILDDCSDMGGLAPWLVLTDATTGLVEADFRRVIAALVDSPRGLKILREGLP